MYQFKCPIQVYQKMQLLSDIIVEWTLPRTNK